LKDIFGGGKLPVEAGKLIVNEVDINKDGQVIYTCNINIKNK